jgi:DNA replication protein DnaC
MNERIKEYLKIFRLPAITENYHYIAQECAKTSASYSEFLFKLLECEMKEKIERSKRTVLKFAGFPVIKTIEMFDFTSSGINKSQITELSSLKFIDNAENIILVGPSGTGKTHMALSLGYIAAQQRIRTRFITLSDLLLQLEIAEDQKRLKDYFKQYVGHIRLLIIDELGYTRLNERQANIFFQLINKRYESGSIIITSNLSFLKWKEVLNNDEALTAAVLDRLIHHSHIVNITGESYRLKQKKKAGLIYSGNVSADEN